MVNKKNNKKINDISINEKLLFDDRITSQMIQLYNKSCSDFKNVIIYDPIYILDHIDECKLFYINYNKNLLNNINIDNIDIVNFNKLINSSYSEYMNLMLNINIYK
jgi:hypothetical protein